MQINLKKIKIFKSGSRETLCFTAEILINGVAAGGVRNDGQGGNHFYEWNDFALGREVHAYCAALPGEMYEGTYLPCDLDTIVDAHIDEYESHQWMAKQTAKRTLFRVKTRKYAEGEWDTVKSPFSPDVKKYLVGKYGASLGEIANETHLNN